MVTVSVHAYPWDVLGDEHFVERVLESTVDEVTLAVSYHSTRAATPAHPARRLVDAHYSAFYRPVRASAWGRLRPYEPEWMSSSDSAGEAVSTLVAAGIRVNAWLVLAHNSRLGREHPDLTVVNCFGERYPYALCPSWAEVVDHCATLAAEGLRDLPVSGVSLESCGQMGVNHQGCHEKTYYSAEQQRLLSICCCAACGNDPAAIRAGRFDPEAVLAARAQAAGRLRFATLAAVSAAAPTAQVTLHAHPDPWATGSSPGLADMSGVDRVLIPCWPHGSHTLLTGLTAADAYVSVLPPFDEGVEQHVRQVRAAGATGLALYHLGLSGRPQRFAELARIFRESA